MFVLRRYLLGLARYIVTVAVIGPAAIDAVILIDECRSSAAFPPAAALCLSISTLASGRACEASGEAARRQRDADARKRGARRVYALSMDEPGSSVKKLGSADARC